MKRLRTILRCNEKYFKYIAIFVLFISLIWILYYPYKSKYNENISEFEGKIIDISLKDNRLTMIIKAKEKLVVNYYEEDFKKVYEQ